MPTTRPSSSVARAGRPRSSRSTRCSTRVGGVLGGGVGLATGVVVALFPFAAVGGGLLAGTAAGGAILGAVAAGHAAAGMSRHDLKELGEHQNAGQAGLVVVAVADMGAKVEQAMKRAAKLEQKQIQADPGRARARCGRHEGRLSAGRPARQPFVPTPTRVGYMRPRRVGSGGRALAKRSTLEQDAP